MHYNFGPTKNELNIWGDFLISTAIELTEFHHHTCQLCHELKKCAFEYSLEHGHAVCRLGKEAKQNDLKSTNNGC